MLSFLNRDKVFIRTSNAAKNPIVLDEGRASLRFSTDESSPYFITATVPPRLASEMPTGKDSLVYPDQKSSTIPPPVHWHVLQDETFVVKSGRMLATLSGKQRIIVAGDQVLIPRGDYHTFSNASDEDDLVVDITLSPDNRKRDELFFRNIFGYHGDCALAKISPSPFQAMLFLWSADIIPALPGPKPLMAPLARFLTWFAGVVIGKGLLGYKETYPEYTP